ncbi:MAG TPA: YtxH domain-containing protein [Pyrinomonadaceae bacterium]|nr:YtxH domain-containing protein [Pyrinomonadaceae bacterium]
MKGILAILSGIGVGAALMYLFDPQDGNRRRALIRDKATALSNDTQEAISGKAQDLSNRAKGLIHEAKSTFSNENQDVSEQAM